MGKYERIIFWSEEDQKWLVDVPDVYANLKLSQDVH